MNVFSNQYEEARRLFLNQEVMLKKRWHQVDHQSYPIVGPDLTVDVLKADAKESYENFLVLISGVHGIEGYLGSALQSYFCQEWLDRIDPNHTGIMLVHGVNPWGMKAFQRNNENNIDLNRNFRTDWGQPVATSGYEKLLDLVQPQRPYKASHLKFYGKLAKYAVMMGRKRLKTASLIGQYSFDKGIYYGGTGYEASTKVIQNIYRHLFESSYRNLYVIDLHTGYGPKNQMTIVNSPFEKRNVEDLKSGFDYPCFTKLAAKDFYAISGDMIDYFYKRAEDNFKGKQYYATCFEFGTTGDSLHSQIEALELNIAINQVKHYGSCDEGQEKQLRARYRELYYPSSTTWKEKALADFNRALSGFLDYFGLKADQRGV